MSAKSSLYYGHGFHLYSEAFDDTAVYLQVDGLSTTTTFHIPLHVWKQMRRETLCPAERYSDLTDAEFLAEGVEQVRAHRAELEKYKDHPIAKYVGSWTFGPPETDEHTMLCNWLTSWDEVRYAVEV